MTSYISGIGKTILDRETLTSAGLMAISIAPWVSIIDKAASSKWSWYRDSKLGKTSSKVADMAFNIPKYLFTAAIGLNVYEYKYKLGLSLFAGKSLYDSNVYRTLFLGCFGSHLVLQAIDKAAHRLFSSYNTSKIPKIVSKVDSCLLHAATISCIGMFCTFLFEVRHSIFHRKDPGFFKILVEKKLGKEAFFFDTNSTKDGALVFKGTYDYNGVCLKDNTIDSLRELSTLRDIKIVEISSPEEICPAFEESLAVKPIRDIVFYAHGKKNQILLSKENPLTYQQVEKLSCLQKIPKEGSIVLFCCETGNKLGKAFTNLFKRAVFAPKIFAGVVSFTVDRSNRLIAFFNWINRGVL